jgi:hypothetical protein
LHMGMHAYEANGVHSAFPLSFLYNIGRSSF